MIDTSSTTPTVKLELVCVRYGSLARLPSSQIAGSSIQHSGPEASWFTIEKPNHRSLHGLKRPINTLQAHDYVKDHGSMPLPMHTLYASCVQAKASSLVIIAKLCLTVRLPVWMRMQQLTTSFAAYIESRAASQRDHEAGNIHFGRLR